MNQNNIQNLLTLDTPAALAALESSVNGLKQEEVLRKRAQYGANEMMQPNKRSHIVIAISHAMNPLVGILLFAAFISALTGGMSNAAIIMIIVIISIGLDYFQSHRSLVAAQRLQDQVKTTTHTLRDGKWVDIPARELVPGDIINLFAGNLVPADSLLLSAKDLHVQQAVLTGESLPVEKEVSAQTHNAVFAGTSIVSGTATAVVANIGAATQFGNIAAGLNAPPPHTEFDKGMLRFGLFIMKTVFFIVLFVFILNIYLDRSALESLLFALALAVGLTPELLPMITTVTLAKGAMRMAKQKVIVKNLAAIQNFGSIDILCSDKTGTLTAGEMMLEQTIDLSGKTSESVMQLGYMNSLYTTGTQNPLDVAVLKKINNLPTYPKIDEIPFDFKRRCVSVVVDKNGTHMLITKGAPELVIKSCTQYVIDGKIAPLDDKALAQYTELFNKASTEGYRVLAIAYRDITPQQAYHAEDEKDLILAGFFTFMDPPLADVGEVIQELKTQGVLIKILTGDNDLVAAFVCKEVGLDASKILLGDDLEKMSDFDLGQLAEHTQIFARVTPAQKQRIITLLRARGHVVGYMGDGINDAPSLHIADVGISVSDAVDVAREAADIILLEQNLRVLLNGIIEGRKSFGNVMKYLMVSTSSNFGNMLSMTIALFFIPFLPATATQLLLNNLLYDISQISIATDNVDESFTQKPRHWNIDIVKKFMLYLGPLTSVFDLLTFFVMLKIFHASEKLFQTGWFVESLATQILVIFVVRTVKNCWQSKPSLPLVISVCTILALAIILPFSPAADLFGFVPLPMGYFIFLVAATLAYLSLMEVLKKKLIIRWLAQGA
jgi:Mg2+-importing ATPase